jgi:hypothetical protein
VNFNSPGADVSLCPRERKEGRDGEEDGERGGKKTSGLAAVFAHLSTHIIAVEDDLLRSGVSICSKASKVYTCV